MMTFSSRLRNVILLSFLFGGLFVVLALFMVSEAQAQEETLTISISPLTFDLTSDPGDTLTNKVKIYNSSPNSLVIQMDVEDVRMVGEKGEAQVGEVEDQTYALKRWVTITPDTFTLEPNTRKVVSFAIDVPEDAEPGGHYASILAKMVGSIGEDITGVALGQEIGSLIILAVAGDVIEELQVVDFEVPSFSQTGPIDFSLRFENKGTVHVRPKGFIAISRGSLTEGKKIADLEIPPRVILPNSKRLIETTWNDKWLFGEFTATLVAVSGPSNNPIGAVTTFWIFPVKLVGSISLGVFIVLLTLFLMRRRLRLAAKLAIKALVRGEE